MSRIASTFAKLKKENRAALVPFIMGGDPNMGTTAALLDALPKAGADIIEIGVPFSEPMADGPTIQAAGERALKAGATLAGILKLVEGFRARDNKTPIILMGYYNPIYRFGHEAFCKRAAEAGVDGLIIVDLPPEEENEIRPYIAKNKLDLIRLIAPTSNDTRLKSLMRSASGFVYYIAVTGITGTASANVKSLKRRVAHVREFTNLPVAVGFGIKTPEQAAEVGLFADAVVVGSALVSIVAKQKNKQAAVKAATAFVKRLAKALRY